MAYLFILLISSFKEQFFFSIEVQLIAPFVDCAFDIVSKNILPNPGAQKYSFIFSSQIFIVLYFCLSSMIQA